VIRQPTSEWLIQGLADAGPGIDHNNEIRGPLFVGVIMGDFKWIVIPDRLDAQEA